MCIVSDVPAKDPELIERLEALRHPIKKALRRKNLRFRELLLKLQPELLELDKGLLIKALRYASGKGDVRCFGRGLWHLV